MTVRAAAIGLALAALASGGRAWAVDDPSCAQYQEPMAYNACLARHGPKANDAATHPGLARPGGGAPDRASEARTPAAPGHRWQRAERGHGRVHMEFLVR